jgi:hypothetical protein
MDKSLFLTADRHRALSVEGMAVCGDAAAALAGLFIITDFAAQAAARIDHMRILRFFLIISQMHTTFNGCIHTRFMLSYHQNIIISGGK